MKAQNELNCCFTVIKTFVLTIAREAFVECVFLIRIQEEERQPGLKCKACAVSITAAICAGLGETELKTRWWQLQFQNGILTQTDANS